MDIYVLLAAVVALITGVSAYLLFNDVPDITSIGTRRQSRR